MKNNQLMPGDRSPLQGATIIWFFILVCIMGVAVLHGAEIASTVETFVTGAPATGETGQPVVNITDLETGPKTINLPYVLRARPGSIRFDAYRGVNDYLSTKYPVSYPDELDYWLQFIDESVQDRYMNRLVDSIRAAEPDRANQVRAAISLVQKIPYIDYEFDTPAKYPYHVLYHQNGDCDEKSLLLAYLLRELGYGVALFEFEEEGHMAVGIRAPEDCCYRNTGYAFIETTIASIPTDALGEYGEERIRLRSDPKVFVISEGEIFEEIRREHADAIEWNRIRDIGGDLDQYNYGRYQTLARIYGMDY